MKILKTFVNTKELYYKGHELIVPVNTAYIAAQPYGESGGVMLIAYKDKPEFIRVSSGGVWSGEPIKVVALAEMDKKEDCSESLVSYVEEPEDDNLSAIRSTLVG